MKLDRNLALVIVLLGVIGLGFSVAVAIEMMSGIFILLIVACFTKVTPDPTLFVMLGMTALGAVFSVGLIVMGILAFKK